MASKNHFSYYLVGLLVLLLLTGKVIAKPVELNPSHPDQYIVVKGDTLWDISARFLKSPWRWPDIWQANSQIANPHLIYPGDLIELSFVDGEPRLTLKRGDGKMSPSIRYADLTAAIPVIPIDAIAPFINSPRVISQQDYDQAPYIVAFSDEHILGSSGNLAYVRTLDEGDDSGYVVIRLGEEYVDGQSGESLGFEATFIADTQIKALGDPATILLPKTTREVVKGDKLVAIQIEKMLQNYYPHAPANDVRGHIIGVIDGVNQIGQYNVVVIDRGEQDGIEVGHVLTVDQAGETIRDVIAGEGEMITLPDEEAGTLMVFRVFDRVSYALIMEAKRVMHRLDVVHTP